MSVLIAPSLLSADFSKLGQEIDSVLGAGADWIHLDIMDGHFVPNLTIGPVVLKSLRKKTKAFFDTHLMIENPEKWIDEYADAGADLITFHVEAAKDPRAVINQIKAKGKKAGLSLRPQTALEKIEPYLSLLDLVLIMTVSPGFGGQSFMEDQVDKVKTLARYKKEKKTSFLIEVDGGIQKSTAKICVDAGAEVLVAGSFIFAGPVKERIQDLRASVNK